MNLRSPRFLFPLLAGFLLLIVGIGVVVVYLHSSNSPDITIVWRTPTTSFMQQDQQNIENAWKTALIAPSSSRIAGHEFTIVNAQRRGDWAIFSANERETSDAQPIASEPLFFFAHLQGGSWAVWTPSTSGFCQELKQIPDALLDLGDKQYFLGCYQ